MERRLIRTLLLPMAVAALLLTPGPVGAHAELMSSSPAADAELETPPTKVVVAFDGELDPAASGFVVTDGAGLEVGAGEVDLEVAERNELRGAVEIEEPGTYTVAWTAAAADGHAQEGTLTFTVLDPVSSPPAAPDTALSPPGTPGPGATLGLALVGLSLGLGIGRLSSRWVTRS